MGEDPLALKSEIDKLATWAAGEPFGEREVEVLVAANADVPIYELTEAWAVRDASRALGVSETLFEHESRQRRDTAARLAGSLGGHLGRIRALKRLAAEGVSSKEAASQLKLNPFYASKLYRQAEGFSEDELDDAVLRLAELDGALKGQSRLAPDLEVQRTLVDLTRRPGATRTVARRDADAGDELRGVRLLPRGGVRGGAHRADGAVDRPHELAVLRRDEVGVPVGNRGLETLCQGLDRRPVAEVLDSLPLLDQDALLLLLDVRHSRKSPLPRAARW